MKNYRINKQTQQTPPPIDHYLGSLNLPSAVNTLGLPEEIIIPLALSGAIRSNLPSDNPCFSDDDISELAEAIDKFHYERSRSAENITPNN